jgi:hypothetical protein
VIEIFRFREHEEDAVHEKNRLVQKIWVTFLGPIRWAIFEKVDESCGFQNAKITLRKA